MKVMVISRASKASEAGDIDPEMFAAMDKFIEELINAGIMLDGTGLTPTSRGCPVFGSQAQIAASPTGHSLRRRNSSPDSGSGRLPSLQEAIDWVKKFLNVSTEESDVEIAGPLMEPRVTLPGGWPERLEEVKELEARSGDRDGFGLARFK